MKIRQITIDNFKGIRHKTHSFTDGRPAMLLGFNGTGKSSFIEAVYWALTGITPQNPIADGASGASVYVTLEDGTEFSRHVFRDSPTKVIVDGNVTAAKNLNALIKEKFGFGTDVLKVTTSADVLASMKSDELGDFLLQYVSEELNVAKIIGFISEPTAAMQEAVCLFFHDGNFGISEVEKAYEDFVENRKVAKKDLAATLNELSKLVVVPPTRGSSEIQKLLEDVLRQEGAAKASHDAIKLYESTKTKREAMLKNLDELQKRFASCTAERPNPMLRSGIEQALADAEKRQRDANSMIGIMLGTKKTLSATLEKLATNHCPLSDSLVCTTDKTKVKDEIVATIKSNDEGIALQTKIVSEASAEIEARRLELKKFDANALAYKEKILLGEQLERVKKSIPELPPRPSFVDERDFEREKKILQAELEQAKRWTEKEKLEKRAREEEDRVELYDNLCKAFAPKGEVMTRILASYLSIFEDEINSRANSLRRHMSVKLIPENGVKYYIKIDKDKEYHLYDDLSSGEKTLAVFLLLDLVSSLCGTKIMIIDDLNHLDKIALDDLFDLITDKFFLKCYDNIILASVNNEDTINVVKKHPVIQLI